MEKINNGILRTDVLPEYNCNNCKYFNCKKEIVKSSLGEGLYAIECDNVVHPLEDCVLRGFKAHSEQPSFAQTLNKKQ